MDNNKISSLIFVFTLILFTRLFVDIKCKRQENKLNKKIERPFELQMGNQLKASWHKGLLACF